MTKDNIKKHTKKRKKLIILVTLVLLFWIKGVGSIDPDFGWRIKAGQLYINKGIPETDPFTYTMADFPWVDHAWVVSLIMGFLFPFLGMAGLSFLFLLPAVLAVYLSAKRERLVFKESFLKKVFPKGKHLGFLSSFAVILAFAAVLPFSGIRAQNFSWFFLSILLFLVLDETRWKKYRLFIPFYFLLWGNLHGSFAAGLITIFLVLAFRSIRKKRLQIVDLFAFMASSFFTLINPYGVGTWREVASSVTDSSLRWEISEWMPAFFTFNVAFLALLTVSIIFIWIYKKKFYLEEKVLYLFFLIQAVASVRHVPLWIIVTIPLISKTFFYFYKEVKEDKESLRRFGIFYKLLWYGSFLIFAIQTTFVLWGSFSIDEGGFYPKNAVDFIKKEDIKGEIFSKYGWGGYLVWKMPERKVFVDGRMPSWRWHAPESNLDSAFETYSQITNGEVEYNSVFEKYGVRAVLWPKPEESGVYSELEKRIESLIIKKDEGKFNFVNKLEEDGWKRIYEDDTAVIYQKNK